MQKLTRKELQAISNEELMNLINNCAVVFHLLGGRLTQLCENDLQVFDKRSSLFYTKTGIKINLKEVDYIEVIKTDS